MSNPIWNEIRLSDGTHVLDLPDDWRDLAKEIAAANRMSVVEALTRRVEINAEAAALRHDLRKFGRLLQERVERKSGGDWLTSEEAARLLGRRMDRDPKGPIASAVVRLNRSGNSKRSALRFDRAKIEAALRSQSSLSSRRRTVLFNSRASSPVKENER